MTFNPQPKPAPREKKSRKFLKRTALKKSKVIIKKRSQTSLRSLLNVARLVFQVWIVLRDQGLPCISCGATNYKPSGTHYLKAELFSGLIFHEDNCHGGCNECNIENDGNTVEYRTGLIKRIGQLKVLKLEFQANSKRQYRWTREELNGIIERYALP